MDDDPHLHDHPRATLVIVFIYAALVAGGWLLLFLGVFLPRGTP